MTQEHVGVATAKFGPGDKALTPWGEQVVIERVEAAVIITYEANGQVWQGDELTPVPKPVSEQVCLIHHTVETGYDTSFRECGECYHVFQTEEELVEADAPLRGCRIAGDQILSCPYCAHDF
jgi:hypothetical protein